MACHVHTQQIVDTLGLQSLSAGGGGGGSTVISATRRVQSALFSGKGECYRITYCSTKPGFNCSK